MGGADASGDEFTFTDDIVDFEVSGAAAGASLNVVITSLVHLIEIRSNDPSQPHCANIITGTFPISFSHTRDYNSSITNKLLCNQQSISQTHQEQSTTVGQTGLLGTCLLYTSPSPRD